ncbi:multidrug ABC transporter ATP-binding protein [Bacteroidia bacterium]|nr:multidrug ABC transporter ATP-binding protein [Bacteroidia bacterium]
MDVIVENLSKSFGTQKAVDAVSFSVKKGEILGILGPNGAGKTTIMKILTGFLFPNEGNVFIGGGSIFKKAHKIKQHIGFLSESNPLYDDMNVIDFLKFIADIHNIPRYRMPTRIQDMLRICGLEHERHKTIRELSKGYKQRIGIAQALIHEPEVIIFDEPTTGLDPNQIFEIRELIRQIGKERTILLSSHILAEMEAMCNRVLILNKGKIVANNTPDELRNPSSHRILDICIQNGDIADICSKLSLIEGLHEVRVTAHEKIRVHASTDGGIEKAIFALCVTNDWYITEMTPVEKGLEDIFRQLTQN